MVDICSYPIATANEWFCPSLCLVTPTPSAELSRPETRDHDCGRGNTAIAVHNTMCWKASQVLGGGAQYYVQAYGGLALDSFMNQEASPLGIKYPPQSSKLICQKAPSNNLIYMEMIRGIWKMYLLFRAIWGSISKPWL